MDELKEDIGGNKKVKEYIDRISAGEDKETIFQGLPASFRDAIEAGIKKPEEKKVDSIKEQLEIIPPQWKGLTAEALAEIWTVPMYVDEEKTRFELERKRKALEYLQAKERESEEFSLLEKADEQKIEEIRKKLSDTFGGSESPRASTENPVEKTSKREILLPKEEYEQSLDRVLEKLAGEKGIVEIREGVPTMIISDLHARKDFLEKVLAFKDSGGKTALDLLKENKINIVCVGDGMHSEMASNWTTTGVHYDLNTFIAKGGEMQSKFEQYKQMIETAGGKKYEDMEPAEIHKARLAQNIKDFFASIENNVKESLLEEEMARSFGLMKMVMDLKSAYPEGFHYVRGNHDDINETLKGFEKYDGESARVKQWTKDRFGEDFLNKYAHFEASLPLLAKGKDFVVSHAAPSKVLEAETINNRDRQTALSLTWTDNTKGGTNEDIINQTLQNLGMKDARWFIGHRGVGSEKVREQFDGKLIQINHDEKQLIAMISDGRSYSKDQIFDLKQ